jgi:hypothetical protein
VAFPRRLDESRLDVEATAVVHDLRSKLTLARDERDLYAARAAVHLDVVQRLLNDPEERNPLRRRQCVERPLDVEVGRDAGSASEGPSS